MASLTEILHDVKAHLEHGSELAASHVPALLDLAARIEADPLTQAAISLVVPDTTRNMLAGLLKSVEAEAHQIYQQAATAAQVPPEQPADPAAQPAG